MRLASFPRIGTGRDGVKGTLMVYGGIKLVLFPWEMIWRFVKQLKGVGFIVQWVGF